MKDMGDKYIKTPGEKEFNLVIKKAYCGFERLEKEHDERMKALLKGIRARYVATHCHRASMPGSLPGVEPPGLRRLPNQRFRFFPHLLRERNAMSLFGVFGDLSQRLFFRFVLHDKIAFFSNIPAT
jgi:hypothetical protein